MIRNIENKISALQLLDKKSKNCDVVYNSLPSIEIFDGSLFDIFPKVYINFDDITINEYQKISKVFYTGEQIYTGLNSIRVYWFNQKQKQKDWIRLIEVEISRLLKRGSKYLNYVDHRIQKINLVKQQIEHIKN